MIFCLPLSTVCFTNSQILLYSPQFFAYNFLLIEPLFQVKLTAFKCMRLAFYEIAVVGSAVKVLRVQHDFRNILSSQVFVSHIFQGMFLYTL